MRLARARPGDDQHRPGARSDNRALLRVKHAIVVDAPRAGARFIFYCISLHGVYEFMAVSERSFSVSGASVGAKILFARVIFAGRASGDLRWIWSGCEQFFVRLETEVRDRKSVV